MELCLKSCPPSFTVLLFQFLNCTSKSWGRDLGVSTGEGLKDGIMDEHILILGHGVGEVILWASHHELLLENYREQLILQPLWWIQLRIVYPSINEPIVSCLLSSGPSSCAASSFWWQWRGYPLHSPRQPAPEPCQWQSVCLFSPHQHCR